MSRALILGTKGLSGSVNIQGSKNAAQKLIPATIVYPGIYTLRNLPSISDTQSQLDVISFLGGKVDRAGATVVIDTRHIVNREIPAEITAKSTGTFLFAGALLSRFGLARVFHPGGCAIGPRAVTWHLDAFRSLGAEVITEDDHYEAKAGQLTACEITFKKPTVNGTVNAILASVRGVGTTILRNIPREPDIENTVELLNKAGAQITIGDKVIEVKGSSFASGGAAISVIPDKNDAATFAILAAISGGPITLSPVNKNHIAPLLTTFSKLGIKVESSGPDTECSLTVCRESIPLALSIESGAFPKFSTDWGPMMQVLMTQLEGTSTFHETTFPERFKHVEHLVKMGAKIEYYQPDVSPDIYNFDVTQTPSRPHAIKIAGPTKLHGSTVVASDVRAGAALMLAAIAADGKSTVEGYDQVLRGYEKFAERLNSLGANISVSALSP